MPRPLMPHETDLLRQIDGAAPNDLSGGDLLWAAVATLRHAGMVVMDCGRYRITDAGRAALTKKD